MCYSWQNSFEEALALEFKAVVEVSLECYYCTSDGITLGVVLKSDDEGISANSQMMRVT